jgi:voltage-gated potassium channel
MLPPISRLRRFLRDVVAETPFVKMLILLVVLWILFSIALFAIERTAGSPIQTFVDALYWSVAAFSTAGIADTPTTQAGKLVGGLWIIVGSVIFFGTIVATITVYFMRPLQRPARRIVDTIEYNLERLDELSVEELDLLRETTDTLIGHMERLRAREEASRSPESRLRSAD